MACRASLEWNYYVTVIHFRLAPIYHSDAQRELFLSFQSRELVIEKRLQTHSGS